MMDELPEGWIEINIATLVIHMLGGDWGKDSQVLSEYVKVKVIRGTDFKTWRTDKGRNAAIRWIDSSSLEKRKLLPGDIVVEISGGGPTQPVGRTVLIDELVLEQSELPIVCSNFFRQLRLSKYLDSTFINYNLTDMYLSGAFDEYQTQTTNLRNLNFSAFIESTLVSVPPLAEQRRITDKLESLLNQVDDSRRRLAMIPAILKRFRQSVLSDACSGKLTEDWRGGGAAIWDSSTLPTLGELSRGRSRHRPRDAAHLYGGQYPFIQTGDIAQSNGKITSHRQTYSEEGLKQSKIWPPGTVCITIAANIGDTAILTYPACFPDSVVGFIADNKKCIPEYIEYFIRTIRNDLADFAPATAQKNINVSILNEVVISLPPLEEQHEIVRRVDKLFKLADQLEFRYKIAKEQVDKLTQSLLAKAFRGELVPTEAELARQENRDYEPAEKLLERIRQEREALAQLQKEKSPRKESTSVLIRKTSRKVAKAMKKKDQITNTHLQDILKMAGKQMTPNELLEQSELFIDDFYERLKDEVDSGAIEELRPNNTDRYLVAKRS